MDAARIRAKQERASRTPGPGSYDPKLSAGATGVRPGPSPMLNKTLLQSRAKSTQTLFSCHADPLAERRRGGVQVVDEA